MTRAEIEAIRGVACDEMLRQLMERDLLKIVGRSDELGRPFLYGTTRRFLQFFGLRHLDELPRAATLRAERSAADAAGGVAAVDRDQPELTNVKDSQEESEVKIAADTELAREEELQRRRLARADEVRAEDEDDFEEEDDDEDDDDEELDDDDEEDEEEEEFDDEDFDDDWEEVDDDDEDEDEEDEDWDDDEDDEDEDWDEDEEEDEGDED